MCLSFTVLQKDNINKLSRKEIENKQKQFSVLKSLFYLQTLPPVPTSFFVFCEICITNRKYTLLCVKQATLSPGNAPFRKISNSAQCGRFALIL